MPYMKIESPKAINRWDLTSQNVTLIIASFIKLTIKPFILQFVTFYMMAQSDHVDRNQNQGIYIHWLSQFDHCLGKMPLSLLQKAPYSNTK